MKIIIIFLLIFSNAYADNFKFEKITTGLEKPWSLTFVDSSTILITEKPGFIKYINLKNKKIIEIKHNLNVLEDYQGGLLDIIYRDNFVYVSYSENRSNGKSSTSVAKAVYNDKEMAFENIFRSEPPINSGFHFGSRLVIKGKHIYASLGERGKGMIAQDPTNHPGSIIRINLDGTIPKDNPRFKGKKNWLPEIFQIGLRNPQGMSLSPFDNKIYLTNHGARGGDWFGTTNFGENYGWKILGWGGVNYSGTKIGPKWKPGFTKPIKYWVPSIAVSAMTIYKGKTFKEWNGDALITSLKDQSLRKIKFHKKKFLNEKIVFQGNIGRIRDIKIHDSGDLYLLSDRGELWRMYK
jgi:quinoprotein glucose dehydrogenase